MMNNEIDLNNWKKSDINVDSLWIINERDKRGKHKNIYHGNFIPQIPYQLIKRYTKENETVFEPFMGSGTTAVACAEYQRPFIGIEQDRKYFDIACERISQAQAQGRLAI